MQCRTGSEDPARADIPDISGNLHFNIAVFYNVRCRAKRVTTCGNGVCEPGESASTCRDCGTPPRCGNLVCEAGETAQSCPYDCAF